MKIYFFAVEDDGNIVHQAPSDQPEEVMDLLYKIHDENNRFRLVVGTVHPSRGLQESLAFHARKGQGLERLILSRIENFDELGNGLAVSHVFPDTEDPRRVMELLYAVKERRDDAICIGVVHPERGLFESQILFPWREDE